MTCVQRLLRLALAVFASASPLLAFDAPGYSWPTGNVTLQLQLGRPAGTLIDGAIHWDDVAAAAGDTWNAVLQRSRFAFVRNSTAPKSRGNSFNNVFFDSTTYGQAFGNRVLAVTLLRSSGSRLVEADVIVNTAPTWNSYRGGSRSSVDLQRVLVHEFGHVLGLDHPDQAQPPQSVTAIMNSMISGVYTLQNDDIAGATALYGPTPSASPPPGALASQTISAGSPLRLSLEAATSANVSYTWTFTRTGGSPQTLLDGDGNPWTLPTYTLFSAQPSDSGTYSVAAVNGAAISAPASAKVTVTPVGTAGSRLANLSARARAGSGENTFIVGFVVAGTTPKRVLLHALGPHLARDVNAPLADPKLKLLRRESNGAYSLVAENDNWSANPTEAAALRATAHRLGASALADGARDAALLVTLAPGVYSAQVDAQGGTPGIAMVEAYDADDSVAQSLPHRLINLSSRSFSGPGDDTLIAGFVVDGTGPKQVLIRVVGPGLAAAGIENLNTDPNLLLFATDKRVADNDDWAHSNQTDILPAVFAKVGAGALPEGSYDSALLITLPPGRYTAQATGRSGESGVVVVEVYEVPQ